MELDKVVLALEYRMRMHNEIFRMYEQHHELKDSSFRIKDSMDECQYILNILYSIQRTRTKSAL